MTIMSRQTLVENREQTVRARWVVVSPERHGASPTKLQTSYMLLGGQGSLMLEA